MLEVLPRSSVEFPARIVLADKGRYVSKPKPYVIQFPTEIATSFVDIQAEVRRPPIYS